MLEPAARGVRFRGEGFEVPLSDAPASFGAAAGRPMTLGIRAEAVQLLPPDAAGDIAASVSQTELSGPDLIVYATLPSASNSAAGPSPPVR